MLFLLADVLPVLEDLNAQAEAWMTGAAADAALPGRPRFDRAEAFAQHRSIF